MESVLKTVRFEYESSAEYINILYRYMRTFVHRYLVTLSAWMHLLK